MGRVKSICLFCKKYEREKNEKYCHVCKEGNVWTSHKQMDKNVKLYPNGLYPEPTELKQSISKEVIYGHRDRTPRR